MNGSAAYEVSATQRVEAQPIRRPRRLPDAKVCYPPVKQQQPRVRIAPLTVLGTLAVAVLMFLVVYHYASLYEAKMAAAELEQSYARLLTQQEALQGQYESALNMEQVEQRARELGMSEPSKDQIVYVSFSDAEAQTEQKDPAYQIFADFSAAISALGAQTQNE